MSSLRLTDIEAQDKLASDEDAHSSGLKGLKVSDTVIQGEIDCAQEAMILPAPGPSAGELSASEQSQRA